MCAQGYLLVYPIDAISRIVTKQLDKGMLIS